MSAAPGSAPLWLVLGGTGRLGSALRQARPDVRWVGVARRTPADAAHWHHCVVADRGDTAAWAAWLARADAVLDLCAFGAEDAQHLLDAAALAGRFPRLVVAGSIADRPPQAWLSPDRDQAPWPPATDSYGWGKRALAARLAEGWSGPLAVVRLPRLLFRDVPDDRCTVWLREAVARGEVGVAADGRHQPAWIDAADAGALMASLAAESARCGAVTVSQPGQWTALSLAGALAAALPVPLGVVLERRDGPLGGGDERLNLDQMAAWWPDWPWRDPIAVWTAWALAVYGAGD